MIKKRYFSIFLVMLFCIFTAVPVFAAGNLPRLVDEADLLSDSEESALLSQLDEISERQQVDLVVVTVDSLEGASPMVYADDFYDENGYGFGSGKDGILFLISMEERDWYISTTGYGITAVTDAGLEYMSEKFLGDLSEGNYAAAFTVFAEQCDSFLTQAKTDRPYDVGNLPKEPFPAVRNLVIALVIGFIVALIVTGVMKSRLKSVHSQPAADRYVKNGSMQVTKRNDLFLYRHVDRREKPKENQAGGSRTHISSSGMRHGGGGGKF
ncbi:MAG: TPM domain-containing protein [Eubacterium sp.]|nr:TPM domain-containing protein [Eubacterium sp.]